PLRRGALRLGSDSLGRSADRRRNSRILPGPDRPQQDPALCGIRRRISDDGDREDPEISDAGSGGEKVRVESGEDGLAPSFRDGPQGPDPESRDPRFGSTSRPGMILYQTGNPAFFASSFSDTCGRAPICWITSAAASAPNLPAFS